MSFPTDLEIARRATAKPMAEIAAMMGIGEHLLQPYGSDLAKIKLVAIDELAELQIACLTGEESCVDPVRVPRELR